MNELMKKDIAVKVISIFSAVLLWLFVLNTIDNPFDSAKIIVPLSIQNENYLEEKSLGIKSGNNITNVEVEVKGRKDQLSSITARDLEAFVDFSQIRDDGRKDLKVELFSHRDGIQISAIRPKVLSLEVEKIVKKDLKVEVVTVGTPRENYKISKMNVVPQSITIEGLESIVSSASSSKVIIDVKDLAKSIAVKKESKVYGKNDQEIMGLNKRLEVEVNVEVAKEVAVEALIKGTAAADYVVTGQAVSTSKVLVAGLPEVIESIYTLYTDTVNIDNISSTTSYKSKIKMPEGSKLIDSTGEVDVSVFVEKLAVGNFEIDKEDVILQNMDEILYDYSIEENAKIGVKGRQKDLNTLNPNSFKLAVDMVGLIEGIHSVPLKIVMPSQDLKPDKEYSIQVKITKKVEGI